MKTRIIVMHALAALIFLASVATACGAEMKFPFTAVTLDQETNRPLAGVTVTAQRLRPEKPAARINLTSDAEGKVQSALPAGIYRIGVNRQGFAGDEMQFDFPVKDTPVMTLPLFKEAVVSGRLLDEQGKALSGLTVKGGDRNVVTDGNGAFLINGLSRGHLEISVAHPTLVIDRTIGMYLSPGDTRNLGNLTVRRGGALSIHVTASDGNTSTARPLVRLHLTLRGTQAEQYGSSDDKGNLVFERLSPGVYTIQSYDDRIMDLSGPQVEIKPGERSEFKLQTVLRPPSLRFQHFGDTLLPQTAVKVRLSSFRVTEARVVIYAVKPSPVFTGKGDDDNAPSPPEGTRKVVKSFNVTFKLDKRHNGRKTITLPPLGPGSYLLEVKNSTVGKSADRNSKGANSASAPFLVTRLGLVAKNSPTGTLIYAADLVNGRSLPDVQVNIFPLQDRTGDKTLFSAKTSPDGFATYTGPPQGIRVVGRWGDSYAFLPVGREQTGKTNELAGYLYTERPAYRPGQTVYFKGIVRKRNGEGYSLADRKQARVTIVDSSEQTLLEKDFSISATGTFHGEFPLPATPSLGGYTLTASDGEEKWSADFKVLEYRKPEFEVTASQPQKFVLAGEKASFTVRARYYFGAPVTDAKVRYRIYASRMYGYDREDEEYERDDEESGGYEGYADFLGEGEATTSSAGEAVFHLDIQPTSVPLVYSVECDVTDLASRQVSATSRFTVVPSLINLSVHADTYLTAPEKPARFTLKAGTWEGKPVRTTVKLTVEEQRYDKKSRSYHFSSVDTVEAATDATGEGSFLYDFPRPGNWRITASARDKGGREATGEEWVWVWREGFAWDSSYRELGLVTDKKSYKPGDTARLIVKNPAPGASLLLAVEGREVYSRRRIPLKEAVEVIDVPIPDEYAPYVFISASLIHKGRFFTRTRRLRVDHRPNLLNVEVTPDKAIYAPGDTVRLNVKARGSDSGTKGAELSLGVVDEAIYAIARERSDDIYTVFRGTREHLVTTLHSFPRVYLGGAAKDEAVDARDNQGIKVRKLFKDTAFWLPVLQTDGEGRGTAEFVLPDNLTTWRATAIGHTPASEFGSGVTKFISRLDVMARLQPPRYLVQGDELKIPGMVNNVTDTEKGVTGHFGTQRLSILGNSSFGDTVPAGGTLRRDVTVRAESAGEAIMRMDVSAGDRGDAMEIGLPILPRGLKRNSSGNIVLREGSADTTVEFPREAFADGALLTVNLSPNLGSSLNQSLRQLVEFPYGCVEQTMSRFLPAVYVRNLSETGRLKLDTGIADKLPQVLEAGLSRLYDFQHEDGGWGWWKEDPTDAAMTAYVLYGMSLARTSGVKLKGEVYQKGVESLKELISRNAVAQLPFAYRALTMGGVTDETVEKRIEQNWPQYEPSEKVQYIEAILNRGEKERAQKLLEGIRGQVMREGSAAWLKDRDADSWWYSHRWAGSAVEATAGLLETVLRLNPADPLAPSLAEFLIQRRSGRWWNTTRATAMVIKALADYSGETGTYNAQLLLNGKVVERVSVVEGKAVAGQTQITIPAAQLQRGTNRLTLEKDSPAGAAHLSAVLDYAVPPELAMQTPGITIERRVYRLVSRREGDRWRMEQVPLRKEEVLAPGDTLEVRLVIENSEPLEHVIVEDPLPAGFEVDETKGDGRFAEFDWYWDWYTHRERHDERMAFFINLLSTGKHEFRYVMHPELEGKTLALPASVWPMYRPAIRAESRPWEVTVGK